jgi:hypothetical protein
MDKYAVAEVPYKNGYNKALKDFAEQIYEECRIYGPEDTFNKVKFLNYVDQVKKTLEKC